MIILKIKTIFKQSSYILKQFVLFIRKIKKDTNFLIYFFSKYCL